MRSLAFSYVALFLLLQCYSSVRAFAPSSISKNHRSPLAVDARSPTFTSEVVHLPSTSSRPFSILQRLFLKSLQEQEDSYLEMAASNPNQPEIVYILMYNPGTDEEGVHTAEYPKDSESEVILGFEEIGDCIQFASALKGNPKFPLEPVPTPTPLQQMQAAVESMGLSIMVVPPSLNN